MPRAVKFWRYERHGRATAGRGGRRPRRTRNGRRRGGHGCAQSRRDRYPRRPLRRPCGPRPFPKGDAIDFAGHVVEVGADVAGFTIGDQVLGFAPRAAQADFVVVGTDALAPKPPALSWEAAATIAGAGATAWAAVEAVRPGPGETVVVSAAAGGVGVIAAQLARLRGAHVIGTASETNFALLRSLGVTPVRYGPGLAERVGAAAPSGVDAYIDTFGAGNVDVAIRWDGPPTGSTRSPTGPPSSSTGCAPTRRKKLPHPRCGPHSPTWRPKGNSPSPSLRFTSSRRSRRAYRDVATRHTSGKRVLSLIAPADGSSRRRSAIAIR